MIHISNCFRPIILKQMTLASIVGRRCDEVNDAESHVAPARQADEGVGGEVQQRRRTIRARDVQPQGRQGALQEGERTNPRTVSCR